MVGPKWLVHTLIYRSQQFSDHGISGVLYSQTNGYGLIIISLSRLAILGVYRFQTQPNILLASNPKYPDFISMKFDEIPSIPIQNSIKFAYFRFIFDFPPPPASMPRRLELGSWSPACRDASLLTPNKMEWMTLSGPVFFCFVEHFLN
jgi:hypothetical protein